MRDRVLKSAILATLFVGLFYATPAQAQATRTWVSGVGDDVNPCSRTAPCKSFAGAIAKTAAAGEINCIDSGAFGPVNITKSITIDCTGNFAGVLAPPGTIDISINAGTGFVRLRGLSITGQGLGSVGIQLVAAGTVYIEDTVIDGFTTGISVQPAANSAFFINNCTIRNNSGFGLGLAPTGTAVVTGAVTNSRILSGKNVGINAQGCDLAVTNCVISGNVMGIQASGNGTVRISGNTISENATGLSAQSKGFIISYQNNALSGNSTANGSPTSTQPLQ
jgi:hypothetical protein